MYNYENVIQGIIRFMDEELINKMTGVQRWILGTGAGIAASKGEKLFHTIKDHTLLKALDIVDGDNVNIELLYKELYKQASQGPIEIEIPMLGTLKLDRSDVEKIYRNIIGG